MYLKISYSLDFDELMLHLRAKYGRTMFDIDGIGKQLDMNQFSKSFYDNNKTVTADSSIDANANVGTKNAITYISETPKPLFRMNSYYLLFKKLKQLYGTSEANRIIEKQLIGELYINDFGDIQRPYCFNYSCLDVMINSLPFVHKIKSVPPKYFYSFKSQLEQFVIYASNSTLGATGIADFLLVSSLYMNQILKTKSDAHFTFKSKKDCWTYLRESFISFIFSINQPIRSGIQSAFTNISIYDKYFLQELSPAYIDLEGNKLDLDLVQKVQALFLDVMNKELKRTPVTFPVITACLSIDENKEIKDEEFLKFICETNKEFGFINLYNGKTSTLSSCCRLRSDKDNEFFNSFGSGGTKIGSLGVVTTNLPRLAWMSKDTEDFKNKLHDLVVDAAKINNAKRHIIKKRIDLGFAPLYTFGFMNINKQYSTFGINGLNEAIEILGLDILQTEGQDFVLDCMDLINSTNDKLQKKYSAPHNCEQTPSENSAIKLASKDHLMGYNTDPETKEKIYELYSNQFIPLTKSSDILDRIKLQGLFDSHFSGGSILHLNVGEKIDDVDQLMELARTCAKKGVVYWAVNMVYNLCVNGHMTVSNNENCTICGSDIETKYTRVVGFLTAIKNFHKVRRDIEFPDRVFYKNGQRDILGLVDKTG